MLVLLSCAKTMSVTSKVEVPLATLPHFRREAAGIALQMAQCTVEELEELLHVNTKIALENYKRYQEFHAEETQQLAALFAYTGIVFKRVSPKSFSAEELLYAQEHLRLTSFCYGLLRPLDLIRPYRLEGDARLPELGGQSVFDYWKPLLTDLFIEEVKAVGGILCNLASGEMKSLFDWQRVKKEVKVITPEFRVWKNGKLTTVVIYTKMCRGEMTRFILQNRLRSPEELEAFSWEGFKHDKCLSRPDTPVFVNGER